MCGIAGVLALEPWAEQIDERFLASMNEPLRHRGPDGAGLWVSEDRRVGFAHRRLAIIDPSPGGAQPMSDAVGEVWLTYNGEIYNHADLRRELEALGHHFRTDHSDTEVIIHAYRQWGIDAVHRFRGMFAFGLWDARLRRLWLVRDRVGVKPLYYAQHRGRLVFASEIKALLVDPTFPRVIDEDSFFHYLTFLTAPAPRTLFRNVHKLPAGSMIITGSGGLIEERRYWDALDSAASVEGSDDEIAERLLSELRTSVRLRKVSDRPVGVFLSGGIDSSVIAALFGEGESRPVRTFSVGYDQDYGSYRNELDHARMVASSLGTEHHEIRLSKRDLLDFLPQMVELQDEPIADPVCVPVYYVSRLARDAGVPVAQVGEGADELFWGYPAWERAWRLQRANDRWPVPHFLKAAALAGIRVWGKDGTQPYDWLNRAAQGQPIFWGGAEAYSERAKTRLLSPRLRDQFAGRSSWDVIAPIHKRFVERAAQPSVLGWMSYLDLNLRLPDLLLMRVDKMSMGTGLEARVPFLDHEFVSFALGIPEAVKTRGGVLKAVLKRAVRGIIPDQVIDRPKQGFGVPVQEWLLAGLPVEVSDVVNSFLSETDLLDLGSVKALFANPRTGFSRWYVVNVALWWDRFIRQGSHVADDRTSRYRVQIEANLLNAQAS
jgi:asparagine synthase (glutamine-hydrolysing)